MTKQRVLQLIEQSQLEWDNITQEKIRDIDDIIDKLLMDGLDYESITYILLNILIN